MKLTDLKMTLEDLLAKNLLKPGEADELDENLETVMEIVEAAHDALSDGLQWSDLKVLGEIVADFVDLAEGLEGKTGDEKAAFVESAVWLTYKHYDPDIPWVPEFIENRMEEILVRNVARAALNGIVKVLNKFRDRD